MHVRLRWIIKSLAACFVLVAVSCAGSAEATSSASAVLVERFEDLAEQSASAWIDRQEHIQACMQTKGFEYLPRAYVPEPVPTSTVFSVPILEGGGYGIATWALDQRADVEGRSTEPNHDVVSGLSEAEQASWTEAYAGAGTEIAWPSMVVLDLDTGAPVMTDEAGDRGGCLGQALQMFGSSSYLEPYAERLAPLIEEFDSKVELLSADQEWSRCMAGLGYLFESPRGLYFDMQADALNRAMTGASLDDFAQQEIEVSEHDDFCRNETSYHTVAARLDEELAEAILRIIGSPPG